MKRLFVFLLSFPLWVSAATAGAEEKFDQLYRALNLPELIAVMRVEGLEYAEEISETLLQGRVIDDWGGMVEVIYDQTRMEDELRAEMTARMQDADFDALLGYYVGGAGEAIAKAELDARQVLLSEEAEAEAHSLVDHMRQVEDPRLEMLERLEYLNHLIDRNVTSALNSSYEFYYGLIDSGAIPGGMSESDVLREVWAQEPEIRQEVDRWIWAYHAIAYEDLTDDDVLGYIAFSKTEEGKALFTVLFESFDTVFRRISRELGLTTGGFLVSEEI
ncbi:hypothetical protein [Actibacterium pelagium]|uniref:DUF2059 domain-containing protein n=1 Tax=Actibacterium pelagium TaxID=2029103 RepID=A0A917ADP2_9RHOB|nr:hypothetical protein [Actibacterium pelagium]GGE44149.1 hypothetical protein GCM10011517_09750 [Actibacterium pelagium]